MFPHDKIDLRRWQAGDVLRIAGVRQLVEHGDVHMRMVPRHVSHEVHANEAAPASHQNITRFEYAAARHAVHRSSLRHALAHDGLMETLTLVLLDIGGSFAGTDRFRRHPFCLEASNYPHSSIRTANTVWLVWLLA